MNHWTALAADFLLSSEARPLPVPVAGALLALTSALAAACVVKAFGITFLSLPRGEEAEVLGTVFLLWLGGGR